MSDAEIRPGWWFVTGRSQIQAASQYHATYFRRSMPERLPPLPGPPPPLPPELERNLSAGALTAKQVREMDHRRAATSKRWQAWQAKIKTRKLPAPPRKGSVIMDMPATVEEPNGERGKLVLRKSVHYEVAPLAVEGPLAAPSSGRGGRWATERQASMGGGKLLHPPPSRWVLSG